jgi:hypothetical protein
MSMTIGNNNLYAPLTPDSFSNLTNKPPESPPPKYTDTPSGNNAQQVDAIAQD